MENAYRRCPFPAKVLLLEYLRRDSPNAPGASSQVPHKHTPDRVATMDCALRAGVEGARVGPARVGATLTARAPLAHAAALAPTTPKARPTSRPGNMETEPPAKRQTLSAPVPRGSMAAAFELASLEDADEPCVSARVEAAHSAEDVHAADARASADEDVFDVSSAAADFIRQVTAGRLDVLEAFAARERITSRAKGLPLWKRAASFARRLGSEIPAREFRLRRGNLGVCHHSASPSPTCPGTATRTLPRLKALAPPPPAAGSAPLVAPSASLAPMLSFSKASPTRPPSFARDDALLHAQERPQDLPSIASAKPSGRPLTGSEIRKLRREQDCRLLGARGIARAYREGCILGIVNYCRQRHLL